MTTPRVTVPVEPTTEMLEAGILAAWPGPEIVYADEHAGPEFMIAAAFKAMLSARGEVDRPVWFEGAPSQHHAKEWFIAETTFGDRVVLTALPEEYTYDFKTADETYIKADRIKRWMPFPDSAYLPPIPAPAPEGGAVLADACRTAARSYAETNDDYMVGLLLKAGTILATREEAQEEAGEAIERLTKLAEINGSCPGWIVVNQNDLRVALPALRAHPPAPTASFMAKAKHLLDLAEKAEEEALDGDEGCVWPVEALRAAYDNLAQPPAREDAQPAVWIRAQDLRGLEESRQQGRDGYTTVYLAQEPRGYVEEPRVALYTHPAPDALRVAVAKLEKAKITDDPAEVFMLAMEALAALQAEQKGGA